MTTPTHSGRKPDPQRREVLRAALIDYVLQHGVADLSLRPLADALGTSTYTLVYHFGSKEKVLAVALSGAEERLRAIVAGWADDTGSVTPADLMRRLWHFFSAAPMIPYNRLFFEAYGLALRDPARVPGFLENAAGPWVPIISEIVQRNGFEPPAAVAIATLIAAIANGLQLDLLAFHDSARTAQALEYAATMLDQYALTLTAHRVPTGSYSPRNNPSAQDG